MTTKAQESKLGLDFVCSQNLTFYLHKMELVNENIYPKKKKKIPTTINNSIWYKNGTVSL